MVHTVPRNAFTLGAHEGCGGRAFGRGGAVLHGRYHLHVLRTPREVRNAFAYVLLNTRKHWKELRGMAPPTRMDEASSGRWFEG